MEFRSGRTVLRAVFYVHGLHAYGAISHRQAPNVGGLFRPSACTGNARRDNTQLHFRTVAAVLIVTLHQVWQGPAVIVTIFGWLLLAKVGVAMLAPERGSRSLAMASKGP